MEIVELTSCTQLSKEYTYIGVQGKTAEECIKIFEYNHCEFSKHVKVAYWSNGMLYVPADINREWRRVR